VSRVYLERGALSVQIMERGYAWLDTGTPDSLLAAAEFASTIEKRRGFKIAYPEEIAFRMDFIDTAELERATTRLGKSDYATHVRRVVMEVRV